MCAQIIRLFNQFSLSPADLAAQPAADDAIEPVGELAADQLLRFLNEVQVRPRPPPSLPPSLARDMLRVHLYPRPCAALLCSVAWQRRRALCKRVSSPAVP